MIASMGFANIVAVSGALPKQVINNHQLENLLQTTDAWITDNIGVKQRHIATNSENSLNLAIFVAKKAINKYIDNYKDNNINIDLILVATATAEYQFPGIASLVQDSLVQDSLGLSQSYALDLAAPASGFIAALNIASNFIQMQQAKCALIIGVDTFSKVLNWEDLATCGLFGDGAGAMLLVSSELESAHGFSFKILDIILKSDGSLHSLLSLVNSNVSAKTAQILLHENHFLEIAGLYLTEIILELLEKHRININDIDWFVPQQLNIQILHKIANNLNVSIKKWILTIDQHANTGAASIPLSFNHGINLGLFKHQQKIIFLEIGAGISWSAMLVECVKIN